MKKTLFVTVGTSALTAKLRAGQPDTRLEKVTRYHEDTADRDRCDPTTREYRELFEIVVSAHRSFWNDQKLSIKTHADRTSAEMTSTRMLSITNTEDGFPLVPNHDQIVLLASDTKEGKFCASVNAQLMHELIFAPKCTCGADLSIGKNCRSIVIEEIKGMESESFGHGFYSGIFAVLNKYSEGRKNYVNITGGFKGAIPALTSWARVNPTPMFYQHVSNHGIVRIALGPEMARPNETFLSL